MYGMPFGSPNNLLVSTINDYVVVFVIFAPMKGRVMILGLFTLVLTVFATIVLVSLFALHGKGRKLFCGLAATHLSIIMYGSPLTIIGRFPPSL
ncbi:hypothetical protein ACS0TY_026575 [Phlomoides rotata]